MANELRYRHEQTGETLYAVVVNDDSASADCGKYWNGSAFEACTVANWGDYDIALTETPAGSYRYVGDFPGGDPGIYTILVFVRGGGSPAISDRLAAEATVVWTGSVVQPAEKAMEAILAVVAGVSTYTASTGVATFKKQDGSTTGVSVTVSDVGTRSASTIS